MDRLRVSILLSLLGVVTVLWAGYSPGASAQVGPATGGLSTTPGSPILNGRTPLVPGEVARIIKAGPQKGLASPPQAAPSEVQNAIWATNQIIGKPYKYGGGHRDFRLANGYDCSSTISWALNGAEAALIEAPLNSVAFMKWGARGVGRWFTVYTRTDHAFMVVAGLRLDTSAADDPGGKKGPRWRPKIRSTKGYKVRHPTNF